MWSKDQAKLRRYSMPLSILGWPAMARTSRLHSDIPRLRKVPVPRMELNDHSWTLAGQCCSKTFSLHDTIERSRNSAREGERTASLPGAFADGELCKLLLLEQYCTTVRHGVHKKALNLGFRFRRWLPKNLKIQPKMYLKMRYCRVLSPTLESKGGRPWPSRESHPTFESKNSAAFKATSR
ncbi:hypothetical protein DFH06DRAFT_528887 [Mycena polygramma]|nr:hypothetical protein DFH06DRAFT_528887 [Mycena polygramma]